MQQVTLSRRGALGLIVSGAEPSSASDPSKAVGTGPFKFVEWKQKDSLTLAKNTAYWQSGEPYLDGIVMSVSPIRKRWFRASKAARSTSQSIIGERHAAG